MTKEYEVVVTDKRDSPTLLIGLIDPETNEEIGFIRISKELAIRIVGQALLER